MSYNPNKLKKLVETAKARELNAKLGFSILILVIILLIFGFAYLVAFLVKNI